MVISEAKITNKRQITVPIKVMEKLRIKPGDVIVFEGHGDHVVIAPAGIDFTIDDFIKKRSGQNKVRLSQGQLNRAREEAWVEGHEKHKVKNNPEH